jgi:hypothetical protein
VDQYNVKKDRKMKEITSDTTSTKNKRKQS